MADFVLKIANFRCHGNKGMSEPNVTGIVELADPENHTIEPKITTLSYIQPELWQFTDFPIETMLIFSNFHQNLVKQAGRRHGSLASMSLWKYRSSAHLLKLTRTSVKVTGKLVCDVERLVSIMIIRDDVISDVIRPRSTIPEDHIETPYRGTLCSSIVQF